jgi:site-specific recombinase XerD
MCPPKKATTLAERYDQVLHYARDKHLSPDVPRPCPTSQWPPENIRLLEKYRDWLLSGGTAEQTTKYIYLPMAGHILGLNPIPHEQINLEGNFQKAMDYVRAKGVGKDWQNACRRALEKFRRFVRLEHGLGEESKVKPFDVAAHARGLPAWLVTELERYQRIQQNNWRPARFEVNLRGYWCKHGQTWRFLCQERGVRKLEDLKRQHILDYVDKYLAEGHAATSLNTQLRLLHSFLLFLQQEGYLVPQALLRVPRLKQPDPLPKYLTDEQIRKVREEIERGVIDAKTASNRRQALLDRAAFYLLWQGGLRLVEMEELRLEDLDISGRRINVRNGKGLKDRTVYLTKSAITALETYLAVRGQGSSEHVFLYRNAALSKDFIRSRLRTIGKRIGVKVHPHRLRHTCATQLLNAGCRVTSIQAFLGHRELKTTMIYARAYDQNVAEDYFAAMARVEQRLEIVPGKKDAVKVLPTAQLLDWVERLALPELCQQERLEIADSLKQALSLNFALQHAPPVVLAELVQ